MWRLGVSIVLSLIIGSAGASGLAKPRVIDEVASAEKPSPSAVLTLYVDRPWSEFPKFRQALHEKLSAYAEYVTNGELTQSYPWATGKPVRIIVVLLYPPTPEGIEFLDKFKPTMRERGITMQWFIPSHVKKAL